MTLIVGLTGGIGSGKTAISDYFANLGIAVVDADVIAHQITAKDSPTLQKIAEQFGDWVIDQQGNYDRQAMRAFVFDKPNALAQLNAITHPAIRQQIHHQLACVLSPYAILSVPLLFETRHITPSLLSLCDRVLVVDVPTDIQLARASQRDGDHAHIQAIIDKQISRTDRLALAQALRADIIENTGTRQALHTKLDRLHHHYQSLAKQPNHPDP